MKEVKFKFQINDRVTAVLPRKMAINEKRPEECGFDYGEGTIEALCYGKDGVFYRLRMAPGLIDAQMNFFENDLLAGWNLYQHKRA